jgi:hypothetical protein
MAGLDLHCLGLCLACLRDLAPWHWIAWLEF